MKRRGVLLGTTTAISGLAGCGVPSSEDSRLDVTIFNHTETSYTIEVDIFDSTADGSRGEARVYSESITIEPEGQAEREEIAETQPLLARYDVYENNSRQTDQGHIHYYPSDDNSAESMVFDLQPPGSLVRR